MSTVSSTHLLLLALAAVPFSLFGSMVKRSDAVSGTGTFSAGPSLTSSTSVSSESISASSATSSLSSSGLNEMTVKETVFVTLTLSASPQSQIDTISSSSTLSPPYPTPSPSYLNGTERDVGPDYGNVVVRNHCKDTLYLYSVGAWLLGGLRSNDTYNSYHDEEVHPIPSRTNYTEPYRVTCPKSENITGLYCKKFDKQSGQGVAFKISKSISLATDILQLEYALIQNPDDNDAYYRLNYDISLLDCADPKKRPDLYGLNQTTSSVSEIQDDNFAPKDLQHKMELCPGYQDGLSLSFKADPGSTICKSIKSDSTNTSSIYLFDRTRSGEPSLACNGEYKGDVILDLCAGQEYCGD